MSRTGIYETQLAIDSLLDRGDASEWISQARYIMAMLCAVGADFTAESVRERMEYDPPEKNLWGAVFKAAAREGWIRRVGYTTALRPDAHGRVLSIWRAAA